MGVCVPGANLVPKRMTLAGFGAGCGKLLRRLAMVGLRKTGL